MRVLECAVIVVVGAYMVGADTFVESYELLIYLFTGIGGLMLAHLLRTAGLVPRWLASLGMIGYSAILLAIPSDLLGIVALNSSVGAMFYVPGGAFEVILPILLIARGFCRPGAHSTATGINGQPLATVSP